MKSGTLGPVDAPAFDSVWGIQEATDGSFWIAETRGVVHITADELSKFLASPSCRVQYELFPHFVFPLSVHVRRAVTLLAVKEEEEEEEGCVRKLPALRPGSQPDPKATVPPHPRHDIVSPRPARRRRGKNVDRRRGQRGQVLREDGAVKRSGPRKHPLTFDIWWMF